MFVFIGEIKSAVIALFLSRLGPESQTNFIHQLNHSSFALSFRLLLSFRPYGAHGAQHKLSHIGVFLFHILYLPTEEGRSHEVYAISQTNE